ncbi:MAG: U32 family peptidase [Candidatus Cloacimonetes bacterium]|nr:U32 family peptidase [Candidatus Cloacimonadota bacterium]
MKKPELLLPVGNTETFYAALEGGADAIYLGLRNFNARGRAKNFTISQLQSILKEAEQKKIKVYLTLNTLIKNKELSELIDLIFAISQTKISAVIIQDWGVYYVIKKFFPKLVLHASTQMGNHNSLGADFSKLRQFERIILARETNFPELNEISQKTKIELEIFNHGALCYSLSGMCLFSSYLGGMSANRGLCRQPCRRIYQGENIADYMFSLKDLQLIDLIPEFTKLGISSIKIEGRMKSAEYVFNVARAYRMVLDDNSKIEEAKKILNYDFGREKTSYFMDSNISKAVTENPYIGLFLGVIKKVEENGFVIETDKEVSIGNRMRILPQDGTDSKAFKIKGLETIEKIGEQRLYKIIYKINGISIADKVFLIGTSDKKFSTKFSLNGKKINLKFSESRKKHILSRIGSSKLNSNIKLYYRINSLEWLKKINLNNIDNLILNYSKKDLDSLDLKSGFINKFKHKLIIQLPKFIMESDILFYKMAIKKTVNSGINSFLISHLSQLMLFQKYNVKIGTNENVYILNDAAIQLLKENNIKSYVYPYELDYPNLVYGKDRKGIVPLYFYPELFYSRMPVTDLKDHEIFKDRNESYQKITKDGFTIVVPTRPVSFLQYKEKLLKKGFSHFLIDFSYTKPSQNLFRRIHKKYLNSIAEQPSTNYNFKEKLK